jgi:DNA-directed RNA polymerase specialized sigma24 family protein
VPSQTDSFEQLADKLDTLIRLLALQLARNEEDLASRAVLLTRAGLSPKEIARICDTTSNSVSVQLAKARRKTAKPRTKTRAA